MSTRVVSDDEVPLMGQSLSLKNIQSMKAFFEVAEEYDLHFRLTANKETNKCLIANINTIVDFRRTVFESPEGSVFLFTLEQFMVFYQFAFNSLFKVGKRVQKTSKEFVCGLNYRKASLPSSHCGDPRVCDTDEGCKPPPAKKRCTKISTSQCGTYYRAYFEMGKQGEESPTRRVRFVKVRFECSHDLESAIRRKPNPFVVTLISALIETTYDATPSSIYKNFKYILARGESEGLRLHGDGRAVVEKTVQNLKAAYHKKIGSVPQLDHSSISSTHNDMTTFTDSWTEELITQTDIC